MPRRCTVCDHPKRSKIDSQLVSTRNPFRNIAKLWGVGPTALFRHLNNHIPRQLVRAQEAQEAAQADDLLARIVELRDRAMGVLNDAEQGGDLGTALKAIREARGCIELLARLAGELNEGTTVNILTMPTWQVVREVIAEALHCYPDARAAVAEALENLPESGDVSIN